MITSMTRQGEYTSIERKMLDYYNLTKYYLKNKPFYAYKNPKNTIELIDTAIPKEHRISGIKMHRKNIPGASLRESKEYIDELIKHPIETQELKLNCMKFLDSHPEYLI